jgi:hypothetical protein
MIKLKELEEMWNADAPIDQLELGNDAGNVQRLHAKYIIMLSAAKLQLRSAEVSFYKMRKLRTAYYRGEMSQAELKELEWEQYRKNKPLKAELEELLDCDDHLVKLLDKVEYLRVLCTTLESIMKSIHSRTWDIKNAIEWKKFTAGLL